MLLRCRKDDAGLLESVLSSAKEEYAEKAKVHEPEVIIDSIHLAPTHSDHHDHGPSWYIHYSANEYPMACLSFIRLFGQHILAFQFSCSLLKDY